MLICPDSGEKRVELWGGDLTLVVASRKAFYGLFPHKGMQALIYRLERTRPRVLDVNANNLVWMLHRILSSCRLTNQPEGGYSPFNPPTMDMRNRGQPWQMIILLT